MIVSDGASKSLSVAKFVFAPGIGQSMAGLGEIRAIGKQLRKDADLHAFTLAAGILVSIKTWIMWLILTPVFGVIRLVLGERVKLHPIRPATPMLIQAIQNTSAWSTSAIIVVGAGVSLLIYSIGVITITVIGLLISEASAAPTGTSIQEVLGFYDKGTHTLLNFLHQLNDGKSAALSGMFLIFGGVITAFAVLSMLYLVLKEIIETGSEGKFEPDWKQVTRILVALSLLVPLSVNGYGGAQYLLLKATDIAGGLATKIWAEYSETMLDDLKKPVPIKLPESINHMIKGLIINEVCIYAANRTAREAGQTPYIEKKLWRNAAGNKLEIRNNSTRRFKRRNACGGVKITRTSNSDNAGVKIIGASHREALKTIMPAIEETARTLAQRYFPLSPGYKDPLPEKESSLLSKRIAEVYASQVLRNARTANTASQQSFIENTKKAVAKSGWLSAATYISTMSRYTNNYLDAIANVPHVIPPRMEIVGSLSTEAKKAVDEIGPWLAGSQLSKSDAAATRIVDGEGLWQTIFTWLSIDWIFNADGHNPFQELTSLGHYLINGTSTTISFLTAASMGSGRAKALGFNMDFFTSAWQVAGGYIMLVLYIIMAAGIALAFILPNIPFIRYLFAIATWVLAVIEGLISIPIFLWAHVSSSKKDLLAPELMQGYLMILHIILRPALMVFGLVFAMIMFREMMILFNAQFVPNLVGVEDSLDVGLITFAAYLVLYCVIAYGLLNACFKAIDLLPNSVMRWIGSHMSQGQDESNDIVGKASGGASKIETLRFASRGGAIKPGGGGMP